MMEAEMDFNIIITQEKDYLLVKIQGIINHKNNLQLFKDAIEMSKKENILKILVDVSECTGILTVIQRYEISEHIFKLLWQGEYKPIRFAVYGNEPLIDPERFGQIVANNRSILLKATTEKDEAIKWLMTE